jgi:hypothetical protein
MLFRFVRKPNWIDKRIDIEGPCNLSISIDFDDVPHVEVKEAAIRVLQKLNDSWTVEDTNQCQYKQDEYNRTEGLG